MTWQRARIVCPEGIFVWPPECWVRDRPFWCRPRGADADEFLMESNLRTSNGVRLALSTRMLELLPDFGETVNDVTVARIRLTKRLATKLRQFARTLWEKTDA